MTFCSKLSISYRFLAEQLCEYCVCVCVSTRRVHTHTLKRTIFKQKKKSSSLTTWLDKKKEEGAKILALLILSFLFHSFLFGWHFVFVGKHKNQFILGPKKCLSQWPMLHVLSQAWEIQGQLPLEILMQIRIQIANVSKLQNSFFMWPHDFCLYVLSFS